MSLKCDDEPFSFWWLTVHTLPTKSYRVLLQRNYSPRLFMWKYNESVLLCCYRLSQVACNGTSGKFTRRVHPIKYTYPVCCIPPSTYHNTARLKTRVNKMTRKRYYQKLIINNRIICKSVIGLLCRLRSSRSCRVCGILNGKARTQT